MRPAISNRAGGRLTGEDLVSLVPQLERYARVESEQFSNLASGQLTLDQWLALSKRLNALFTSEPDLAGIVVTSGTDTLEELAYFLHLTVRSDRTVVVVGSMRRPETPGYEGGANLLAAFRVAADPESRNRGVLVVLHESHPRALGPPRGPGQADSSFSPPRRARSAAAMPRRAERPSVTCEPPRQVPRTPCWRSMAP